MKYFRITKYDPDLRNDEGFYLLDHWTCVSDVGKVCEGELVTRKMYLESENDYIQSVISILKENRQEYLRLVCFGQNELKESLKTNRHEWFHLKEFELLELQNDKKIYIEQIPQIIKLNLRNYCHLELAIHKKFFVNFNFDLYMYMGAPEVSVELKSKINASSVFIEEFMSPDYSEKWQYYIMSGRKDEIGLDKTVLLSHTIEQIKEILNLSDEHPGNVNQKLDWETSYKLGFSGDFENYEHYLMTDVLFE